METIKLDLIPGKKMPSLHASQFDDGRAYHIDLTENRVPYVLDGTETISVIIRKCDNTLVSMDIANTFANKSYLEFEVVEQMTTCDGFNYGEIILEKNGDRLGSLNFYLVVETAPDENGITSQSEIKNLERQVHDIVVEELADNGAEETGYDNSESGLTATNVQDAIDELASQPSVDAYTKQESDAFITDEYDAESTYAIGDMVIHENALYVCSTAITTAEAWNSAHWTLTDIATAIGTVKTAIPTKTSDLQNDSGFAQIDDSGESASKTYSSNKVDSLVGGVQSEVTEVQNIYKLAIDESAFTVGKYMQTDGKAYNHADYEISPFIKCELSRIKFNCLTASATIASIAFYSKANENDFISCYANTASLSTYPTHEMDVPDGTKYIRVCKQKTSFYVGNVTPYVMSVERYETLTERLIGAEETADEAKAIAEAGSVDTIYRLVKKDVNLIPSDGIILHAYLNDSGEVKISTNPDSANYQMCISGYIPVEAGKTLYLSGDTFIYWRYFGWYDANKDYLGGKNEYVAMGYHNHVADVVVPTGAKYLRITCNTVADYENTWAGYTGTVPTGEVIYSTDEEHLDYSFYPTNPCDFNGNDISVFKKIACIGDSITEGYFNKVNVSGGQVIQDYAYPAMLEKLSGSECVNKGTSGATSESWWTDHSGDDFSGYDCAIINFGINDALQSVPEADVRDAFANIIGALKTANTGIRIFIANVNPAYSRDATTYDAINAIIEDIAENTADCFFLDLTEYGHTVGAGYVNGHLTACGYRQLAQDYKAYISHIVRNNPEDFRFVQFIGTNLYPTT